MTPTFAQISFKGTGGATSNEVAFWVTSADFNGDGYADVATANANIVDQTPAGSVSIYISKGDGTFAPPVSYFAPPDCEPIYIVSGDFNNDKKADLFVSCGLSAAVFVMLGAGDGTFSAPIVTVTPIAPFVGSEFPLNVRLPNPTAPMLDLNHDGNLDLVIPTASANFYSTVVLELLGHGDGTFEALTQALNLGGELPLLLAGGDFNSDGKPDIAVVSGFVVFDNTTGLGTVSNPELRIGLNDGHGTFSFQSPLSLVNLPNYEMTSGDLNGDGKEDLVLAGPASSSTAVTGVVTLLGRGDGTFTPTAVFEDTVSTYPQTLLLADTRNSGKPDLIAAAITASSSGEAVEIAVYPNDGTGSLGSPTIIPVGVGPTPLSMVVGDNNGDGRPDLILIQLTAPNSHLAFFQNQSLPATFTNVNAATYQSGSVATSSIVAAFAGGLALQTASAPGLPLPTSLGGLSINVTDSQSVTRAAPLFYVSPKQLNYAIPDGTEIGTATITITTSIGSVRVSQLIVATSGGIFNAGNIAAADVYTYDGTPIPVVSSSVAVNAAGALVPAVINVGTGAQQVYLILFGTGFRNYSKTVTATVGSLTLPVAYAGPQGTFVGEDQINLLLPQTLAGAGLVNVTLNVDGQPTNTVQIQIQ